MNTTLPSEEVSVPVPCPSSKRIAQAFACLSLAALVIGSSSCTSPTPLHGDYVVTPSGITVSSICPMENTIRPHGEAELVSPSESFSESKPSPYLSSILHDLPWQAE